MRLSRIIMALTVGTARRSDGSTVARWPSCRHNGTMWAEKPWVDRTGLVTLPGGAVVRGRRIADTTSPADFALLLAPGPLPAWPHRRIRWPDFWLPLDRADALDALHEARLRAYAGERVEVTCRGGVGRTGTALAALAVLDGLPADRALEWVRARYHPRAVETPWQRRWLRRLG